MNVSKKNVKKAYKIAMQKNIRHYEDLKKTIIISLFVCVFIYVFEKFI